MKLKKKKLGEREREEVHFAKRARDGSLLRLKSPEEDVGGHGAKKQEQTIDAVHQNVRHEASHSEAANNRSKSESQDEAETLRNFKILPKPVRPPLRVFIPGHKRSPPIFTLPDDLFIPEEDTEDAYADHSYITPQPLDHHSHAQHKPIAPRVLRQKSSSESHIQLRRARSDAKHDMSNVLRAFNEMVQGTEEDFRTLFEGESLSTSLSLMSRDTTRTLDVNCVAEDCFDSNILSTSLSRSRSWSGMGKTSMASRLARAHSISAQRDRDGDGSDETLSLTSDEFDEEKMAPEEWFDMVGLDEYLA